MSKLREWFNDNPAAVTWFCVLLISFAALIGLQGCELRSLVKVDVPRDIRASLDVDDLDKPITLAEVDQIWEDWNLYVQSNTARFTAAIKESEERFIVLQQLTDLGLGAAQTGLGGLPGGAILLSGLSLVTGLFLKRPGEDSRVSKEKQSSYNAGIALAAKLALSSTPPQPPAT